VARALAQEPQVLLADEPVASLDPVTAHDLLAGIRRVCREDGLTAVISLHQLDYARGFGERIVGLREGRIAFDGGRDTLKDRDLRGIYDDADAPGQDTCPSPAAHGTHDDKGVCDETRSDDHGRFDPPDGLRGPQRDLCGTGRVGPEGHGPSR
jgi:ABC-type multidrug transport system ATPase subunit